MDANEGGFKLPKPQFLASVQNCQATGGQGSKTPCSRQQNVNGFPPLPTDPCGLYSSLLTDSDMALGKKKFIKVSGVGEVEVEPDRIDFVIQITSVKEDVKEARDSVKKRSDYILAALRKFSVQDWEITSSEMVTKVEPCVESQPDELNPTVAPPAPVAPSPPQFKLVKEINVHCDNLMKYISSRNVCLEKLDQFVVFSEPVIKFSTTLMQLNTQRAIRQAVTNSQVKATELLGTQKTNNLMLGQLLYTVEDGLTIKPLDEYDEDSNFEYFKWKRLNKRVTCQITSVFEITERMKLSF